MKKKKFYFTIEEQRYIIQSLNTLKTKLHITYRCGADSEVCRLSVSGHPLVSGTGLVAGSKLHSGPRRHHFLCLGTRRQLRPCGHCQIC